MLTALKDASLTVVISMLLLDMYKNKEQVWDKLILIIILLIV